MKDPKLRFFFETIWIGNFCKEDNTKFNLYHGISCTAYLSFLNISYYLHKGYKFLQILKTPSQRMKE